MRGTSSSGSAELRFTTGSFVRRMARAIAGFDSRAMMPSPRHSRSHGGGELNRSRGSKNSDHGPCSRTYCPMPCKSPRP
jgi:hypothetical protein